MFSGIVESVTRITRSVPRGMVTEIQVARPDSFDDLHIGDSVSVNGVCLTVEQFTVDSIQFVVGLETIRVTGWDKGLGVGSLVNLERSMRLGDRVHGHLVTGHVQCMGVVHSVTDHDGFRDLSVDVPPEVHRFIWEKGSLTINGVSLTLNKIEKNIVHVGLIPETLKRTNLSQVSKGDRLTLEPDYLARALLRQKDLGYEFN